MKITFINTAFDCNNLMTIDTDDVSIVLKDTIEGISKQTIIDLFREMAIEPLFEMYNPNSFLTGLAYKPTPFNLSISIYLGVQDGYLTITPGHYGTIESSHKGNKLTVKRLVLKTNLKAVEHHHYEQDWEGTIQHDVWFTV